MAATTKPKKERILRRVLQEGFTGKTLSSLLKTAPESKLSSSARDYFEPKVMAALRQEFRVKQAAMVGSSVPSVVLVLKESGEPIIPTEGLYPLEGWVVVGATSALSVFGYTDLDTAMASLQREAAHSPGSITILVCPFRGLTPQSNMLICVCMTETGQSAAFILMDEYELPVKVSFDVVVFGVNHVLSQRQPLPSALFANIANVVSGQLVSAGIDESMIDSQALAALLQDELVVFSIELGCTSQHLLYNAHKMFRTFAQGAAEFWDEKATALEAEWLSKLKRLSGKLEQAERLAESSTARANRMSLELQGLRKHQELVKPVKSCTDTLGAAIDRLFS